LNRRAIDVYGHEHPFTLTQVNNLGVTLVNLQRNEEAIPLLRGLVEARRRVLGDRHPETLKAEANLSSSLVRSVQDGDDNEERRRRTAEAVASMRRVLAARQDLLGIDHPDTLLSRASLASMLMHDRQYAEALPLAEQVLAARQARHGPEHRHTVDVRDLVADIHLERGDLVAARAHYEQVLRLRAADYGESGEHTLSSAIGLYRSLPPGSAERLAVFDRYFAALFAVPADQLAPGLQRQRERIERHLDPASRARIASG